MGNAEFQHQHRTVSNVYTNPARSKHTMATSLPHHNVPQYNMTQNSMINQRSNPVNTQIKHQQIPPHLSNMQQQPPQTQRTVNAPMQLVMNQNYNSNRTGNNKIQI